MALKTVEECCYYLVREHGGEGVRAKDIYFDHMLAHVRDKSLGGLSLRAIEIRALVLAAPCSA